MTVSDLFVLLLQTGFVLLVALAAGFAARRRPALRSAVYRLSIVAVLVLLIGSPWLRERAHPIVPVPSDPGFSTVSLTPTPQHEARAPATSNSGATVPSNAPTPFDPWSLVGPLWLAGTLLLLLHLGAGTLGLARVRAACRLIEEVEVRNILAEVSAQAGIAAPALVEGPRVGNPFVAGVLRGTIFLPAGWCRAVAEDVLRAVLRHEVAHLAQRDLRWGLLHRLVCIALWPQPLLWLLRRPMMAASEELCDRRVVVAGMPDTRYAECLLSVRGSLRSVRCPSHGIGVVGARSSVGKRVEALLDPRRSRAVTLPGWVSAMVRIGVLSLGFVAVLLFARPTVALAGSQEGWVLEPYDGRVRVLSPEGAAVEGASAWLILTGDLPEARSLPLKVEGGDVVLAPTNLPPRTAGTLLVKAKGLGMEFARLWPAPQRATRITLSRGIALQGRLVLPNGQPAAGVRVQTDLLVRRIPRQDGEFPFSEWISDASVIGLGTTSGADGSFRIEGLPPLTQVKYDVDDARYARLRHSDRAETGAAGVTTAKEVTLRAAGRISGRVTRDGVPVAGVRIGAQDNHLLSSESGALWASEVTGADGRYTLGRLSAGVVNVATDLRNGMDRDVTAVAHEAVTVKEGEAVTDRDFELIPGVILEGRVTDQSGAVVKEVYVGVYGPAHPESSAWVQAMFTDGEGRYRFRVPSGRQRVYVGDSRYTHKEQIVVIADGSKATVNFQVAPAR